MIEQQCRELIKKDLQEARNIAVEIISTMDELDLNDIDFQIDRTKRFLDSAKDRLKNCEDF